jgi:glycine reductase
MLDDLHNMVKIALKVSSREKNSRTVDGSNIGRPSEDNYYPRERIVNEFVEKTAAERAVDMVLAKIHGKPFQTEAEVPEYIARRIAPPLSKQLREAKIAVVTDGGLVPKGNPDHFLARASEAWGCYEMESILPESDPRGHFEIVHAGYSNINCLENPYRLVPVDILRELQRDGYLGQLHPDLHSACGNAGTEYIFREIGRKIAKRLKSANVDGVILTST